MLSQKKKDSAKHLSKNVQNDFSDSQLPPYCLLNEEIKEVWNQMRHSGFRITSSKAINCINQLGIQVINLARGGDLSLSILRKLHIPHKNI